MQNKCDLKQYFGFEEWKKKSLKDDKSNILTNINKKVINILYQ